MLPVVSPTSPVVSLCDPIFSDVESAERFLLQRAATTGAHRRHDVRRYGSRWYCADCATRFSVRRGTLFAQLKLPLPKLLVAAWLFAAVKRGLPADELARTLGIAKNTAWHTLMTFRECLPSPCLASMTGVVEADETYFGGKPRRLGPKPHKRRHGRGTDKQPVVGMVARDGAAMLRVVDDVTRRTLHAIILSATDWRAVVVTDSFAPYRGLDRYVVAHLTVNHRQGQFLTFDDKTRTRAHTNTVECLFSQFKRAVGTNVSRQHLQAYCNEVAWRWTQRNETQAARFVNLVSRPQNSMLRPMIRRGSATLI